MKRSFSCLCNYSAERRQKILDSFQSSIAMNSGYCARFKREDGFWWVPCGQFPARVRVQLNIRGLSLWAQWVLLDKAPKPRPLEARGGFCHQLCPRLSNQWLPRNQMFLLRKTRQDRLSCRAVCDGLILAKNSASLSLDSHRR